MPLYRKKPIEIEARRVQTDNLHELAAWCDGVVYDDTAKWDHDLGAVIMPDGTCAHVKYKDWGVIIRTLEGDMLASFGDWIIKGVKGEFYPIKDAIFRETYEAVE